MQDFSEKSIFPLGRGTIVLLVLSGFVVNGSVDLLATALITKFSSAAQEEEGRTGIDRVTNRSGGKPKVKLKCDRCGATGSGTIFENSECARIEFCSALRMVEILR